MTAKTRASRLASDINKVASYTKRAQASQTTSPSKAMRYYQRASKVIQGANTRMVGLDLKGPIIVGKFVDRDRPTQVGRALRRLGIEHIAGYSPQARGRSERANGTIQGRLVNELRIAKIRTLSDANQYLRDRFIPNYNDEFGRLPADPASAFVCLGGADLDQILCHEETRIVAKDNTATFGGIRMQILKQPGRHSCARLQVVVRQHLDGTHSIWYGQRRLGHFDAEGGVLESVSKGRNGRKALQKIAA